jgi:hypothetical protein
MAETASPDLIVPSADRTLSAENAALARATSLLSLIARSGTGLGEVLRDYASQTSRELLQLNECLSGENDNPEFLARAPEILRAAATVMGMTPAAMRRNHATAIGDDISADEVADIAQSFALDPEIIRLLAAEA